MARAQPVGTLQPPAHGPFTDEAWFCLRAQQRHEHVAASHLRLMEGVEVFHPRVRFSRLNHRKKSWFTESLFPGYLFARFHWRESLTRVHYAPGVQGVVHFGCGWPTIPDQVIEEIRSSIGPDAVQVIPDEVGPGDEVKIIGTSFNGLTAVITQVMPGRERVAVLLEFLGRQSTVEVSAHAIVKQDLRR